MIFNKVSGIIFLFLCAFISNGLAINRGLNNLGNTCYMNASLQCLLHTKPFIDYLMHHSAEYNYQQYPITHEFINLIKEIRKPTNQPFSPNDFYNVGYYESKGQQHDAFDLIAQFFKETAPKGMFQQPLPSYTVFAGKNIIQTKCNQCSYTSQSFEDFIMLDLEIHEYNNAGVSTPYTELTKSIDKFYEPEARDEWRCKNNHIGGTLRKLIDNAPQVLIIHLLRFGQNPFTGEYIKLNHKVSFNETIDLSSYSKDASTPLKYSLIGFICHSGGMDKGSGRSSGHYYSYCKDFENKNWYQLNDSSVSPANNTIERITKQEMEQGNPYIIFYQRQDQAEHIQEPNPEIIAPNLQPQEFPEIEIEFAYNLRTLRLTTEDKKNELQRRLDTNPQYRLARTPSGESPLHLFVIFLKKLLDRKSDLALIRDGHLSYLDDNFYDKSFDPIAFEVEFSPSTYFDYFTWLAERFDVNAQTREEQDTVSHLLLKDSSLQKDLAENEEKYRFKDFFDVLMTNNTNFNLVDKLGKTPFYLVIEKLSEDNKKLAQTLIKDYKAHIDVPTYSHQNVLHVLMNKYSSDFEIAFYILDYIIKNAKTENFSNATSAPTRGLCELIKNQDDYGKTPLHYALEKGHIEAAKALLDLLFKNNEANYAFFELTSNPYGGSPGKSIQELINQKNLTAFVEALKKQNLHQEETATLEQKNVVDAFDGTVQKLLTNTTLSEKIKKLEADKTLNKIKKEIIQEVQTSTKPLQNEDILDLITKKLIQALTQPQDPLSEKLNLLKQRLTQLKTKLGLLRNSLEVLKKHFHKVVQENEINIFFCSYFFSLFVYETS